MKPIFCTNVSNGLLARSTRQFIFGERQERQDVSFNQYFVDYDRLIIK
ncbi:MAG: hypothetical protein HC942_01410 [Microcoleus sp. SU_5_6]|nr:hypothetical protein [Microcoleus sp. SU_5_6]